MAHVGDQAGVSRAQRAIRALEMDAHSIDRMREALRLRLEILSVGA
jgi:hypothetical protein